MKIYKAYKFRMYPNTKQQTLINKTLRYNRVIYNHYLSKSKKDYKERLS